MDHTIRVIPSKRYVHLPTGRQASIYGAAPWTSESDRHNWELQTNGYTWEVYRPDGSYTIGLCRIPESTLEGARSVARRYAEACAATVLEDGLTEGG